MEKFFTVFASLCAIALSVDLTAPNTAENIEQTNSNSGETEFIHALPVEDGDLITTPSNPEHNHFLQQPISAQARHHPNHIDESTSSHFQQQVEQHNPYNQFYDTLTPASTFDSHSQPVFYEQNIHPQIEMQHNEPLIYRSGIFTIVLELRNVFDKCIH